MPCLRLSPGLVIFLGLLLNAGCGGDESAPVKIPETVSLSGTVKLDGQPLAGARVVFASTAKGMYNAEGVTNDSGVYELTVTIGSKFVAGAMPGIYNVQISRFVAPDGTPQNSSKPQEFPGRETVPEQYSVPAKSKLQATVAVGRTTQDFDLKSK